MAKLVPWNAIPLLAIYAALAGPTAADVRAQATGPAPARCDTGSLGRLVGRPFSPEAAREAQELSGARMVRSLAPESIPTMDFRYDRLNIQVDAAGVIAAFSCR